MAHNVPQIALSKFNEKTRQLTRTDEESLYPIAEILSLKLKNHNVPHIVAQILDFAELWR